MALAVQDTAIGEVKILTPKRFGDDRGYFSEVYNESQLAEALGALPGFVQDNESMTATVGTVRGLHYQLGASVQAKLVRAISGAIIDVAVDLRQSSPTFGKSVAVELTSESGNQLWIPDGFAHGFCTLVPNTVVGYKTTNFYDADSDRSIAWDDPDLAVEWPAIVDPSLLSAKDASAMKFSEAISKGEVFE